MSAKRLMGSVQEHYRPDVSEVGEVSEANYKIVDGAVHITKAEFRKVHKDFKSTAKGKERMLVLDPKQGSVSRRVVFVDESVSYEDMEKLYVEYMKTFAKYKKSGMDRIKASEKAAAQLGLTVDALTDWYSDHADWREVAKAVRDSMIEAKLIETDSVDELFDFLKRKDDSIEVVKGTLFLSDDKSGMDLDVTAVKKGQARVGITQGSRDMSMTLNGKQVSALIDYLKTVAESVEADSSDSVSDVEEAIQVSAKRRKYYNDLYALALKTAKLKKDPNHTTIFSDNGDFVVHDRGVVVARLKKGEYPNEAAESVDAHETVDEAVDMNPNIKVYIDGQFNGHLPLKAELKLLSIKPALQQKLAQALAKAGVGKRIDVEKTIGSEITSTDATIEFALSDK